ncbi:MAG TPA: MBL fold metallo-hydrolase [Solirubrobacteraceae bacterium]|jgi:glyoxylase-like metal-dependent hydrolase (beta-lactamase superfamily II)
MKIHALTTGTVALKDAFLHARSGWRRQPALFLPGQWSESLPIHCWAIEHLDRLWLVDTGETSAVRNIPFARFDIPAAQELPGALEAAGLSVSDVDTVVITHMHGDHIDGAIHVARPALVHEPDLAFTRTAAARFQQRLLRQPIPPGVQFEPFTLDASPFGAFTTSRRLSDDGRIVAVPTPGHTVGHVSVICVDDQGRHVMLAGDATDTVEQLHARRAGAVDPKPAASVQTMETILAHGAGHSTVYLPSHDPDSTARLRDSVTL